MNHLSSFLAITWTAALWQGFALALLAVALLRLTPRASAAVRHTILLIIFATATVLPFVHPVRHPVAAAHSAVTLTSWFAVCIAVAWIVASSVRAVSLFCAWLHLRRIRREAQPIAVDTVQELQAGNRRAALRSSNEVNSPAIIGFFRPVLLLPAWLVPSLSSDELQQLALHEGEHLRRRDDWINLALQVSLVAMPLNPALLWLNRRIGVQRELACDEAVVASTAKPLAYAASLTRMAEQRMQRNALSLALAAWGRKSELALRVHALLREPVSGWTPRQSLAGIAAAGAAVLFASAGLAHAPSLVSVVDNAMPSVTVVAAQTSIVRPAQAPDATLLPVSYEVPAKAAVKPKHKTAHRTFTPASTVAPRLESAPHFLRASFNTRSTPIAADSADEERPVRFVTTEFVQPYVAVPVSNGWLLIEL